MSLRDFSDFVDIRLLIASHVKRPFPNDEPVAGYVSGFKIVVAKQFPIVGRDRRTR